MENKTDVSARSNSGFVLKLDNRRFQNSKSTPAKKNRFSVNNQYRPNVTQIRGAVMIGHQRKLKLVLLLDPSFFN